MVDEARQQQLIDFVLGNLEAAEAAKIEEALAKDDELAAEVARISDDLADVAFGLPEDAPPAALKQRILDTVAKTNRFRRFADRLAELIKVGRDAAARLLSGIDDPASFEASMVPGISLYHLESGAALPAAVVGFIKIKPGVTFPHHEHVGDEIILVVQGSYRDSRDGSVHGVGDEVRNTKGSQHDLVALDGPDLIYLAIAFDGIIAMGQHFKPGDPRI